MWVKVGMSKFTFTMKWKVAMIIKNLFGWLTSQKLVNLHIIWVVEPFGTLKAVRFFRKKGSTFHILDYSQMSFKSRQRFSFAISLLKDMNWVCSASKTLSRVQLIVMKLQSTHNSSQLELLLVKEPKLYAGSADPGLSVGSITLGSSNSKLNPASNPFTDWAFVSKRKIKYTKEIWNTSLILIPL